MQTVAITVTGKVQGVFFRKYAVEAALKCGVNGYVMNTPEGSVYIVASGEEIAIRSFVAWCYTGSPNSKVDKVILENLLFKSFSGFVIRFSKL